MRPAPAFACIAAALMAILARPALALDIVTTDGETFSEVAVSRVEADAVRIIHSGGSARIPVAKLDPDALEKLKAAGPPEAFIDPGRPGPDPASGGPMSPERARFEELTARMLAEDAEAETDSPAARPATESPPPPALAEPPAAPAERLPPPAAVEPAPTAAGAGPNPPDMPRIQPPPAAPVAPDAPAGPIRKRSTMPPPAKDDRAGLPPGVVAPPAPPGRGVPSSHEELAAEVRRTQADEPAAPRENLAWVMGIVVQKLPEGLLLVCEVPPVWKPFEWTSEAQSRWAAEKDAAPQPRFPEEVNEYIARNWIRSGDDIVRYFTARSLKEHHDSMALKELPPRVGGNAFLAGHPQQEEIPTHGIVCVFARPDGEFVFPGVLGAERVPAYTCGRPTRAGSRAPSAGAAPATPSGTPSGARRKESSDPDKPAKPAKPVF